MAHLDADVSPALNADYSRDPQSIRFVPIDWEIIEVARDDTEHVAPPGSPQNRAKVYELRDGPQYEAGDEQQENRRKGRRHASHCAPTPAARITARRSRISSAVKC